MTKDEKPLTSLPHYKPNYALPYRPAEQLSGFCQTETSHSQIDDAELQYIYSEVVGQKETDEEPQPREPVQPPSVQNPFDFPSLPTKGQQVTHPVEEENDSDEAEAAAYQYYSEPTVTEIEEQFKQMEMKEEEHLERIDLDDPIFRNNYPDVIEDPSFTIPSPKIKTLSNKLHFEVHLTVVYSPSQFWFQYGDESLYVLMNSLYEFYSKLPRGDLVISAQNLKPGLMVAAQINDSWHRAQVIYEPNEDDEVRLFFVDFGTHDLIHICNVRYLLKRFSNAPLKALRGSMVGACPKYNEDEWNISARKEFYDMVSDQKLYATIRFHREDDDVYDLELTSQINSLYVADIMIHQGLADHEEVIESFPFAIPLSIADNKLTVA